MSVDYKAILLYGYKVPIANREYIPDELFDEYGMYQDAYHDVEEFFFGVKCGQTTSSALVDMVISEEDYEQLTYIFNEVLPPAARDNVLVGPQLYLIQGVW